MTGECISFVKARMKCMFINIIISPRACNLLAKACIKCMSMPPGLRFTSKNIGNASWYIPGPTIYLQTHAWSACQNLSLDMRLYLREHVVYSKIHGEMHGHTLNANCSLICKTCKNTLHFKQSLLGHVRNPGAFENIPSAPILAHTHWL